MGRVYRVNVFAPLYVTQLVLPSMRARGSGLIVNITSDAAVEAYPTWGGYGSSKAALEHISRVLAAELVGSGVRVLAVDPGDMNTQMHRDAEPGEDLSHLPGPEIAAGAIADLIENDRSPFRRVSALAPVPAG
jgi:NAD(P)-dependent dehydrogenase (short-subunit alcohol dehydrogenase family)